MAVPDEPVQALVEQTWSTAEAPRGEQFGLWEQAVDQAFVPVTVRSEESETFVSSVGVRRFGPVDLADIASPAQSVSRTPGQIAAARGDVFFLNLPLSGGATVRQDGRLASCPRTTSSSSMGTGRSSWISPGGFGRCR